MEGISQSFHEHGILRGVCQSRMGELLLEKLGFRSEEEGRSPFSCKYTRMQTQKTTCFAGEYDDDDDDDLY